VSCLLFAATLFSRSLRRLDAQDGGFERDTVQLVRVEPRGSDQRNTPGTAERLDRTYRALLERVRALPGVHAASLASFAPTTRVAFSVPLRLPNGEPLSVGRVMAYPGYFESLGVPMIAGRDLGEADLDPRSPPVAVINETLARKLFPGESPLGRQFMTRRGSEWPFCEIIGVVKDSRYGTLRGETPPLAYQPFLQTSTGRGQMVLHVRTAAGAVSLPARIRAEVQRIDKDMPVFEVHTLSTAMAATLVRERLIATLSSFFGGLALLLACIGIYGLLAFAVVQRSRELGIRIAVGARRADVAGMVMRESLGLVCLGLAAGIPAALALGRVASSQLSGLLYGVQATDMAMVAVAALTISAAALLAAYGPARRAARADPMIALRSE